MTWDAEANDLFPHEVTLAPPGALNQWGRKAVGATQTRDALVEYKMRQIRTVSGQDTASSIAVYLSGSGGVLNVTPEWTIALPGGESRPILSVSRYADETGDLLEVLYLQ